MTGKIISFWGAIVITNLLSAIPYTFGKLLKCLRSTKLLSDEENQIEAIRILVLILITAGTVWKKITKIESLSCYTCWLSCYPACFKLINFAMESIPRFIRNLTNIYKHNRRACMNVTYVDEKVTLFLSLTEGFCFWGVT